jgi:hypothetical protein
MRAIVVTGATAVLLLTLASAAPAADVPESVRSAGYGPDDWQKLAKGKVITRVAPASGPPGAREGSGAFVTSVPWRHAFEQLGRIEEMPNYSSCLKPMEILMRASRAGRNDIKARETHKTLWITARYTLDYQEDPDRREIRWKLDPAAQNDVTRMSGSWTFIPLDGDRTLVTYRLVGSSGAALPAALEDFFAARMLPGFLTEVRQQIERAHARGGHH